MADGPFADVLTRIHRTYLALARDNGFVPQEPGAPAGDSWGFSFLQASREIEFDLGEEGPLDGQVFAVVDETSYYDRNNEGDDTISTVYASKDIIVAQHLSMGPYRDDDNDAHLNVVVYPVGAEALPAKLLAVKNDIIASAIGFASHGRNARHLLHYMATQPDYLLQVPGHERGEVADMLAALAASLRAMPAPQPATRQGPGPKP